MNVASKDLSQELYELAPEWNDTEKVWRHHLPTGARVLMRRAEMEADDYRFRNSPEAARFREKNKSYPAYALGYLLRKLEPHNPSLEFVALSGCDGGGEAWQASVMLQDKPVHADIPEDAAIKLCIELIKQGVMSPNGEPTK